ncbi:MAG: class I SAM-dependent methyltransferase [bacterium]
MVLKTENILNYYYSFVFWQDGDKITLIEVNEMLEADLCKKIIDTLEKKGAMLGDTCTPPLVRPEGSSKKDISDNLGKELLNFFENDVFSFTELLKVSSHELENTLEFDLNKIYTGVALSSQKTVEKGSLIEEKLPKSTAKLTKELFRFFVWPWVKSSYFVSRGLLKPHGFPGDYVIVESMYEGNAKSTGLGYVYDIIFLNTQLCQGLRNRKDQMKQIFANFVKLRKQKPLTILNVGCGGSRDLREVALPDSGKGFNIYLTDFDKRAIDFSIDHLSSKTSDTNWIPLNIDVKDLTSEEGIKKHKIASCDLIYSIGLFDYLPDRILIKLLENLLVLLKDDGLLVFAHKDYTHYNPRIADWFCDWKYYSRTQQDFETIFKSIGIDISTISFSREKDGYIFFAHINKPIGTKTIKT